MNILIYRNQIPYSDIDMQPHTDVRNGVTNYVNTYHDGVCPNYGNSVWMRGLISHINNVDNHIDYLSNDHNVDLINNTYDAIVLPMANIFSKEHVQGMYHYAKVFSELKIPVYVISCGAQAEKYDNIHDLVDYTRDAASSFIRAIYATGGEFALRGYFTQEYFHLLGFNTAVVTGCPSIYMGGPHMYIDKENRGQINNKVYPVFNGCFEKFEYWMNQYVNSEFIEQDQMFDVLFSISSPNMIDLIKWIKRYGYTKVLLCLKKRIHLIPDIDLWYNYLLNKGFSLSIGTRIHGTIMALLAGIPATIYPIDSRTREMAEFYHIPMLDSEDINRSVEAIYEKIDFTAFNKARSEQYYSFRRFLMDHDLVTNMNVVNTIPLGKSNAYLSSCSLYSEVIQKNFNNNRTFLKMFDRVINYYRKIK